MTCTDTDDNYVNVLSAIKKERKKKKKYYLPETILKNN